MAYQTPRYSLVWMTLILLVAVLSPKGARADAFTLQLEPIIGYERVQEFLPTTHSVNRFIYGASLTAGYLILSAEAVYTHGETQETYPDLTQASAGDRLKIGLRSGTRLLGLLTVYLRGGMQASQDQTTQIKDGITTTHFRPMEFHPYVGAGARLQLSTKIHASIDVVTTVKDINQLEQNEYQISAGFGIRLP